MSLYEFLVVVHVIGTVLGVGAATFAEVYYTKFNADNILTDDERNTLATTYTIMRTGLFLLIISGFSFLLYYRIHESVGALKSPEFLAKMTIIGVLVGNALMLQARWMPLAIGAAVSLTSWYAALVLGVIGSSGAGYFEILAYYIVAMVIVGVALRLIRSRLHAPSHV